MPDERKPAHKGPALTPDPTPEEEDFFARNREAFFNSKASTAEIRRTIVASIQITDQELLEALTRRQSSLVAMEEKKL